MSPKWVTVSLPAAAVTAVVIGAGIELWVRATWQPERGRPGFFLADPARGIRLATNYTGWFAGVPVRINRLGLRDPREYDLVKGRNTFRILLLGDSVTFGHGSIYEHTYPYLLEQRLKTWRPAIDWQVWNAAVPGYNTSQELAHLQEVGPQFAPDLVIIGFFENDLIDNIEVKPPGAAKIVMSRALSFAARHFYSIELYKRLYLQLAWRLAASDQYRRRLDHLGAEETLLAATHASGLSQQALTRYERLSDEQVRKARCDDGMKPDPGLVPAIQRQRGYAVWLDAVRTLQRLHRDGTYRIVFFLNVVPAVCPDGDLFYDGGTAAINDFYLSVLSEGTPAVSCYDAFRHVRPSQMPLAAGHSIGNSNAVKADELFTYLQEHVLPGLAPGGTGVAAGRSVRAPRRARRQRT